VNRSSLIAAFVLLAACDAPDPSAAVPPAAPLGVAASDPNDAGAEAVAPVDQARALFDALLPDLRASCGGCHSQGTLAPLWLASPDFYASVKGFEGLVGPDPSASKLLRKGRHSGPDLSSSLRTRVQAWLEAEAKALAPATLITTGSFAIVHGANVRELGGLGNAPFGARLEFDASWAGDLSRLKISGLTVVAPAQAGVHVVHPRFGVARERDVVADPIDGFSALDQTIAAGQSQLLGDGLIFLESWTDGDELAITFEDLESSQ
jgi:hypothetical protein